MSINTDTDELLNTSLWGEQVTIVRNTITYGSDGDKSDSWGSVSTPNADIQPLSGAELTREIGSQRSSTHKVFLPAGNGVLQGDRIRPSGWSAGNDEHHVDAVMSFEDHVEVMTHIVKGHA